MKIDWVDRPEVLEHLLAHSKCSISVSCCCLLHESFSRIFVAFLKSQSEWIKNSEGDAFSAKDYLRETSYFIQVLILLIHRLLCVVI